MAADESGGPRLTGAGKAVLFLVGLVVLGYVGYTYRDRLPALPALGGGGATTTTAPAATPTAKPAATPAAPKGVLARIRQDAKRALELPEVRDKLHAAGGLEPFQTTPQEFAALIRRDYERFGALIKQIGIKAD